MSISTGAVIWYPTGGANNTVYSLSIGSSFGDFLFVEGLVKVRDLTDDYYIYDENQYALIGKYTKKVYRLGDKVKFKN